MSDRVKHVYRYTQSGGSWTDEWWTLTLGESFFGAVKGGSERYYGFTMLSSVGVTLGARLMMKADPCRALCSAAVHDRTRAYILYQHQNRSGHRHFVLEGMQQTPHEVFQPVAHLAVNSDDDRFFGEAEHHEHNSTASAVDDGGGGGGGGSIAHVRRDLLDVLDAVTNRLASRVALHALLQAQKKPPPQQPRVRQRGRRWPGSRQERRRVRGRRGQ